MSRGLGRPGKRRRRAKKRLGLRGRKDSDRKERLGSRGLGRPGKRRRRAAAREREDSDREARLGWKGKTRMERKDSIIISTIIGTFPSTIDIIINTSIILGKARPHLSRTVKGASKAAGETRIGGGKMRAVMGAKRLRGANN